MVSAFSIDPQELYATAQVGRVLNQKWRLARLLGIGGSAAVYEAIHANGRRAALKLFAFEGAPTEVLRARARYESQLANSIDHPGVVEVLDDDISEDGSVYLVMELLEGQNYEDARRHQGGRLSLDEAAHMLRGLLEILDAMHARGILHRDVKPGNVLLTKDGQVKLLDLGLARMGKDARDGGEWFGTPGFLPPEQARGAWSELDASTDLWAAAATFYTVLTGRLVHKGHTTEMLVRAAARGDDAKPLYLTSVHLATSVVDVITRALAIDKADRWPSARSMARALDAALRGTRPARVHSLLPPRPISPACRSATRVFRLEEARCAGGARRAHCVVCPVCPLDDARDGRQEADRPGTY
jgi:serine/threonine-protein kinase